MDYPTDKIIHFADGHTYWFGAEKLSSISVWKKQWMPPFDKEYWLKYKTLQEIFGDEFNEAYKSISGMKPDPNKLFGPFLERIDPYIFQMRKQSLEEQWERKSCESLFRGSRFHKQFEDKIYENGYMINPWDKSKYPVTVYDKFYDNESLSLNLFDLPDGGYPELLIHDLDLGLCGQSDEIYIQTVGKKRYVDINDHKTGEEAPKKTSPDYCYPPFEDEQASAHFGYTLQVNMYGYMLSKHGFTVRNMAYTYYKNYDLGKPTFVNVPNLQKKLSTIIK